MFPLFKQSENNKKIRREALVNINKFIYNGVNEYMAVHQEEFTNALRKAGYSEEDTERELDNLRDEVHKALLEKYNKMLLNNAQMSKQKSMSSNQFSDNAPNPAMEQSK